MISAIIAHALLKKASKNKKTTGGMFSVGATPFNSAARQTYGGWTLRQAGNSPWAQRQWHMMSAKYNPNPVTRQRSRDWVAAYRLIPKAVRKEFAQAGRKYWDKAVKVELTPEQKEAIFNEFESIPLSEDDVWSQFRSNVIRNAPYPSIQALNTWPFVTAPLSAKVENLADLDAQSAALQSRTMADMFRAARAARKGARLSRLDTLSNRILANLGYQPEAPAVPDVPIPALDPAQQAMAARMAALPAPGP